MPVTIEQLQALCDGKQFSLSVVTPTMLVRGLHPVQARFPSNAHNVRVAISWSAVLRGRPIRGNGTLVTDASLTDLARQAVLDYALDELSLYELRIATYGRAAGGPILDGVNPTLPGH